MLEAIFPVYWLSGFNYINIGVYWVMIFGDGPLYILLSLGSQKQIEGISRHESN